MKKLILFIIITAWAVTACAQVNRANTKKSTPYNANYQSLATGVSFQFLTIFAFAIQLN